MKIRYDVVKGQLRFEAYLDDGQLITGPVPSRITSAGDEATEQYVDKQVRKGLADLEKKAKLAQEKRQSLNLRVSTTENGVLLGGQITENPHSTRGSIRITLESPEEYVGSDTITDCMGAAMAGHYVFNEKGELTTWGIERAKQALIRIYNRRKSESENFDVFAAAARLNSKTKTR